MKNHYRNRCTVDNQNELKIENILTLTLTLKIEN
jgi:hypothetical protein